MKRLTAIVIIISVLLIALSPIVLAQQPEGKGKPEITGRDRAALAQAGHNPDALELIADISVDNPSSKTYFDTETGDEVLVVSAVPLMTPDGVLIDPTWYEVDGGYDAGNNFFRAEVRGTEVKVWWNGERSFWNPEIYVDDVMLVEYQTYTDLGYLEDDRMLGGDIYPNNTVSWRYKNPITGQVVCTRLLRLVEGAIQEKWIFNKDPEGEVRIDHRQSGRLELWVGRAIDANYVELSAEVRYVDDEIVPRASFLGATYPVTVYAFMTFYSDTFPNKMTLASLELGSGIIDNDTWATLLAGDGDLNYYDSEVNSLGWLTGTVAGDNFWYNTRVSTIFDTSALPETSTVDAASISVFATYKADPYGDAPSINIYQADVVGVPYWPPFYDNISNTAWSATPLTYANWSIGNWNGWVLNAAGRAGINKAGYTPFGFREVNYDIAAVTPTHTDTLTQETVFSFYGSGIGSSFCPRLVVTYSPILPAIVTTDASEIKMTTAVLNSVITNDGGMVSSVRFGWGNVTQTVGNFNLYDTITPYVGGYYTDDHPSHEVVSLTPGETYYYRAQISNVAGIVTSTTEISFTAAGGVGVPSEIYTYDRANEISLSWTKGTGATETLIRYSTDTYPLTVGAGLLVYDGQSNSFTHTGLNQGTTHYYTFWGTSGANTSLTYALTMASTTGAFPVPTHAIDEPVLPDGTYDDPDASNLPSFIQTPLYAAADAASMDKDNGALLWFGMGGVVLGAAIAIYINGAAAFIIMGAFFLIVGALGVVTLLVSILLIIFGLGMGILGGTALAKGA